MMVFAHPENQATYYCLGREQRGTREKLSNALPIPTAGANASNMIKNVLRNMNPVIEKQL